MKNIVLFTMLFVIGSASAQSNTTPKTNNIKLKEAFKIQEENCLQIEQLLLANTAATRKINPEKTTEKGDFYKRLRTLYANFKLADKHFQIANLTALEMNSIEDFYNTKLAKIDSLYALRNTSLPITVVTENESDILKDGKIPTEKAVGYTEPSHENCKAKKPDNTESCVSFLFRKYLNASYNVPEFRFYETGIKTSVFITFIIDKSGTPILTSIHRSSKHFEFDMETINTFDRFAAKYKFTPAISNGRLVGVSYACPVNIITVGNN